MFIIILSQNFFKKFSKTDKKYRILCIFLNCCAFIQSRNNNKIRYQQNSFSIPTETSICQRLHIAFPRCFFIPYLKHILTLWLCSISSIIANSFSLLDKSYKKTTKNFQSILKTDSKLSAFFHRFRLFLFPPKSIVFLTLVLSSELCLFIYI